MYNLNKNYSATSGGLDGLRKFARRVHRHCQRRKVSTLQSHGKGDGLPTIGLNYFCFCCISVVFNCLINLRSIHGNSRCIVLKKVDTLNTVNTLIPCLRV